MSAARPSTWCPSALRHELARASMALLLAAVFAALLALGTGCGPSALKLQAVAAHALAGAGAKTGAELRRLEEAEGHAAIDRAAPGGQAAIDAALADVEARWEPALEAVRVLEEAADSWVSVLEARATGGDWAAVLGAACRALGLAREIALGVVGGLAGLLNGACP